MTWLSTRLAAIRAAMPSLQKAPSHRPDLAHREHVYSSAATGEALTMLDSYIGNAITYSNYVWVRKAIGVIVDNLAPLPVRVVNEAGEGQPRHELSRLLADPNDLYDPSRLWAEDFMHELIGGESPIEIVNGQTTGRPNQLWPRRPDRVVLYPDWSRINYPRVLAYEFTGYDNTTMQIPGDSMIFRKFYNPLNVWRGISPMRAIRESIALDIAALAWSKGLIKSGAKQDFAISSKQLLTPDERARIEAEIMEKLGTGVPFILSDDTTVVPYSWAPKDMEWADQRRFSRDEVGSVYGVPDEIMGYGRDTYENFDTAFKVFWLLTLRPLVQKRDTSLTKFFTRTRPMLRPGERIETDLSGIGVLQDDITPRIELAIKLFERGVPFNILDERFQLGIGKIPGGDVGFVGGNLIPILEAANPAPPPAAPPAFLPPVPAEPTPADKALMGYLATLADRATASEKAARRPSADRTGRALQRIRKRLARKMETAVEGYFADLATTVVTRAQGKDFRQDWTKAVATKATSLPDLGDLLKDSDLDALGKVVGDFYLQICEASWETWNAALGVDVSFDVENPAVVAALADAAGQVGLIDDATRTALQSLLQFAAAQGWTVEQLIVGDAEHAGLKALIQETYKGRHKTIARTELGTAQNKATLGRYKAEGVKKVKVYDNGDDDPDSACKQANGSTWSVKKAEDNILEHPNCTRAFAPEED